MELLIFLTSTTVTLCSSPAGKLTVLTKLTCRFIITTTSPSPEESKEVHISMTGYIFRILMFFYQHCSFPYIKAKGKPNFKCFHQKVSIWFLCPEFAGALWRVFAVLINWREYKSYYNNREEDQKEWGRKHVANFSCCSYSSFCYMSCSVVLLLWSMKFYWEEILAPAGLSLQWKLHVAWSTVTYKSKALYFVLTQGAQIYSSNLAYVQKSLVMKKGPNHTFMRCFQEMGRLMVLKAWDIVLL